MHQKNRSGMTLIELMVTLVIVSIIVTLTFTNMNFMSRSLARAELDKIYAICMYAQRCAMVTNKPQILVFDKTHKSYTFNGKKELLPDTINFGFLPGSKGPPSSPINTITSPITFKNEQIVFRPNGMLQPGTIYITDSKKQYMYAISSPIAQISFLRKYQYTKTWDLIQ